MVGVAWGVRGADGGLPAGGMRPGGDMLAWYEAVEFGRIRWAGVRNAPIRSAISLGGNDIRRACRGTLRTIKAAQPGRSCWLDSACLCSGWRSRFGGADAGRLM